MMDKSERGLERLVTSQMTGLSLEDVISLESVKALEASQVEESGDDYAGGPVRPSLTQNPPSVPAYDWRLGNPRDYDRRFCLDVPQLLAFLNATQPNIVDALNLNIDGPTRLKFLERLKSEIGKRGVIDVLRKGVRHLGHPQIDLFYGTPSAGNLRAANLYAQNRFVLTRQLAYSNDETRRSLDLGLLINGLPFATAELKNSLTGQTVSDAVHQYKNDRSPKEPLFSFGRCAVHFAVDDSLVRMCTHLRGDASWFLPFDKGVNDGAGNPVNPDGIKTAYLWQDILRPDSLTNIIQNYAQIVEEKDKKTGKKKRIQIFPRYHQLGAVRALLADAQQKGAGQKYVIQHSAGSGKSMSIAWLAHQLVSLTSNEAEIFDTVIVVTDRRNLDDQIKETIKGFLQVRSTFAPVTKGSSQLKEHLQAGKKIIVSTIQKFPFIVDEIGSAHRDKKFAIIIDEAHSSQGGKASAALAGALSDSVTDGSDPEDVVNTALERRMTGRKMATNASYFAFTATPKGKTLEMFGIPSGLDDDGNPLFKPFHSYTMKQAIEENFIRDVLTNYTPINSYYSLVKTVEDDPEFDSRKASAKLRRYVEGQEHAVRLKAEIMIDHFHDQVHRLIGGQARAMVVTNGIDRAISYFKAFNAYLRQRKSPYKAIIAFSGEKVVDGEKHTEASLNGFPSKDIPDEFETGEYRFLICADKFQTGFDQPLLQTMYVDKTLGGVQAVQTLSRLNRAHPKKREVFVLDFMNDPDAILASFEPYYRTTILAGQTDPNKLYDLQNTLEAADLYSESEVSEVVEAFLTNTTRDAGIDPILDRIVARYVTEKEEAEQVLFKGTAKAYVRTYEFLAAILPFTNIEWERLSIFFSLLVPKLPSPQTDDLTAGLLETIDLDSYRIEKLEQIKIALADEDGRLELIPQEGGGGLPEATLEPLSEILRSFNDRFGTEFEDSDRIIRRLEEEVSPYILNNQSLMDAVENTPDNAKSLLATVLAKAITDGLSDGTELYQAFHENDSFKRWVSDYMFKKLMTTKTA